MKICECCDGLQCIGGDFEDLVALLGRLDDLERDFIAGADGGYFGVFDFHGCHVLREVRAVPGDVDLVANVQRIGQCEDRNADAVVKMCDVTNLVFHHDTSINTIAYSGRFFHFFTLGERVAIGMIVSYPGGSLRLTNYL